MTADFAVTASPDSAPLYPPAKLCPATAWRPARSLCRRAVCRPHLTQTKPSRCLASAPGSYAGPPPHGPDLPPAAGRRREIDGTASNWSAAFDWTVLLPLERGWSEPSTLLYLRSGASQGFGSMRPGCCLAARARSRNDQHAPGGHTWALQSGTTADPNAPARPYRAGRGAWPNRPRCRSSSGCQSGLAAAASSARDSMM